MSFAAILKILMDVLAAAPGVEADVHSAINAFHATTGDTNKVATIADAATEIANVAANIAKANA